MSAGGRAPGARPASRPLPKAELHVHLEGTVRPWLLRRIARRHGVALPVGTRHEAAEPPADFARFVERWVATSSLLRSERDFREVTVAYAAELATQGCVYVEASFSPAEPARRGTPWAEVFEGYCNGAQAAFEEYGVEVRLIPEITRNFPVESAADVVRWALRSRDRGVVGIGLSGDEAAYPAALFARPFAAAREGGLKAAPHAGETDGPASVREALQVLHADRLRHGVRAAEDAGLVAELAARGIVCDVTLTSNLRLGVVCGLADHPLRVLVDAGVRCSVSSDDPALFGTDLSRECELAQALGHGARAMFEDAVHGAFCDERLRARLRAMATATDWARA